MKTKVVVLFLLICCLACNNERETHAPNMETKPESEMAFDKTKWQLKDGKDYPYREKMLNDILYNDTIRGVNKNEILALLGQPSWERENKQYLYYMIKQKRLLSWPLHTRTMVIKLTKDNTIEWIKIHE